MRPPRRKSGEARYAVRYCVNGKTDARPFKTLVAARDYRTGIEAEALDGVVIDPRAGTRTLDAYVESWLSTRLVKGRPLTPATRIGYQRPYRRNIAATLGARQLRTLRPETIRTWHAEVAPAAGHDQAANSYRLLRAVLATAEADELIRRNPCRIRGGGQGSRPTTTRLSGVRGLLEQLVTERAS